MQTIVTAPTGWVASADGASLAPPGGTADLVVEVTPPRSAPLDPAAFLGEAAARVEPGQTLRVLSTTAARTDCDWPFDRLDALVADAAGVTVEGRLIAVYHFLGCIAVITVRARTRDALVAARPALEALLTSARPDWRGDQVAALAYFWT